MTNNKVNKTSFKKGNKIRLIKLDLNLIVKRYYEEEKSTLDIAKEFNVHAATIGNRLKENGYKLRDRSETTPKKEINSKKTQFKKGDKHDISTK